MADTSHPDLSDPHNSLPPPPPRNKLPPSFWSALTRSQLAELLAARPGLPPEAGRQWLTLRGLPPSSARVRQFASRLCYALGLLLALAGVIVFFAYNWLELDRFTRFAILGVPTLAAALVAYGWSGRSPDNGVARAGMAVAVVLTGALLATAGQVYQSGADSPWLFLGWAVLILPWVVAARWPWLWLFWWGLLLLALDLYLWGNGARGLSWLFWRHGWGENLLALPMLALGVVTLGWEWCARRCARRDPRWQGGLAPAILVALAAAHGTVAVWFWVLGSNRDFGGLALPLYLLWLASVVAVYVRVRRDIVPLALAGISALVSATGVIGRWLLSVEGGGAGSLLLLGLMVAALTLVLAYGLRHLAQAWRTPAAREPAVSVATDSPPAAGLDCAGFPPVLAARVKACLDDSVSPWIAFLQAVGGWLAALFLLAFLGVSGALMVRDSGGWMMLGLMVSLISGFAFRLGVWGLMGRQFLMVLNLVGQGAFLVGALDRSTLLLPGLLGYTALAGGLALLVPWRPLRMLCALAAGLALAWYVGAPGADVFRIQWVPILMLAFLYWTGATLLWSLEQRGGLPPPLAAGPLLHPLADALAVALCGAALVLVLSLGSGLIFWSRGLGWGEGSTSEVAVLWPLGCTLTLLYLGRGHWSRLRGGLAVLLLAAVLVLTRHAPGVGMGLVLLLLGYQAGRRWLQGLGIAAVVLALGQYYFSLETTLLVKSFALLWGGILVLALGALLGEKEVQP